MFQEKWVGISSSNWVFVGIPDRPEFDKLAGPTSDSGVKEDGSHVLTKSVEGEHITVVFQHWIVDPPMPSYRRPAETESQA